MVRECDVCKVSYTADNRNVKRGWGLCCSKSCAAKKRERSKLSYNQYRVTMNNVKRHQYSFARKRTTSEGYVIVDGYSYDEWGCPVYMVDEYDDTHPFDMDY